jgi:hyperosmotically inducible protein
MANEDLPLHIFRTSTVSGRIDPVRGPRGHAGFSSPRARISRRIAFVLGVAMALLVMIVSQSSAQTPPPNRNVTDSRLAVKINTALWSDLRFPGRQISVDTQDGVVTLRGKVDSEETKKAADEIIGHLEGVKEIRNHLQVVPPERRAEVDAQDQAITRALDAKFKEDPQLQDAVMDSRVDAGVVTLRGQVRNAAARSRAVELARAVPGVRSVRNELTSAPLARSG